MPRNVNPRYRLHDLVREFLTERGKPTSFDDIFDYVSKKATFTGKTPRASVNAVVNRMPDVVRTGKAMYRLDSGEER